MKNLSDKTKHKAIMKNLHKTFLIIAASAIMLNSCGSSQEETVEEASKVLVELKKIKKQTFFNELELTGVVQAWEEAYIGAASPARIEKIYVDVGDQVRKGQKIVQMDRTHLYQAKIQKDNLKSDLERLEALLKEGAVTQQNYDQLKAQYDIAVSNFNNLAVNTEILSTLNGIVTGRFYSDGEIFSMSPTPAGKPGIVSVKQINPVKVMVGISENYLTEVKAGQKVKVFTDVHRNKAFDGIINKIYPVIDRASGTFQIEVRIDNPNQHLLPGMFARVWINLGETAGIIVPSLAVLKQVGSNERFVFVVEDGKAVRKVVQLGRKLDDKVEILSGLKAGEKLVVTGQHNLNHLSEVQVVN